MSQQGAVESAVEIDAEYPIVIDAQLDPKVKTYWLTSIIVVSCATIIGIPLLIIIVPLGLLFAGLYLKSIGCALTTRTLEVRKGVLNKLESTIPLERITDLQMFQGPIMRMYGLHGFKVETAGQSSPTGGSLVTLVGIVDAQGFKRRVMAQRDKLRTGDDESPASRAEAPAGDAAVLEEIRDAVLRIEQGLAAERR